MDTAPRAPLQLTVTPTDLEKLFPLPVNTTTAIVREMLQAKTGFFRRKPVFPGLLERLTKATYVAQNCQGYQDWTLRFMSPESGYQYAFFGRNHLLVPLLTNRGGVIFRLTDSYAGPLVYASPGALYADRVLIEVLSNPEFKKLL